MRRRFRQSLPSVTHEVLMAVGVLSRDMGCGTYLVGGIVRDIVIGRRNIDLDITIDGDGPAVARAFAAKTGASFKGPTKFGTCKVESKAFGPVDFAMTRKERYRRPGALPEVERSGITEDLLRRDFTINAMAISVNPEDYGRLIDPFDGLGDISGQRLRILHDQSFADDPTRILRGIRFAARYRFRFEAGTLRHLKRSVADGCLLSVSGKRLYNELRLVCTEDEAYRGLLLLDRYQVLRAIDGGLTFGQGRVHRLRSVSHALEAVEKLAGRGSIVRWKCWFGSLFVGLGRSRTHKLVTFFNLPGDVRGVCTWVSGRLRGTATALAKLDERNAYRISKILKKVPPEALVHLYAACGRHERDLIRRYLTRWRAVKPSLSGGEIASMGLGQSPMVGRILEQILKLRLQGVLEDRNQEVEYVRTRIAHLARAQNRG
jgi:tRNA nucleotidyltransferase (CCA-adding enzyme)